MPDAARRVVPARFRVLVLSRNYPSNVFPRLGLWVYHQARLAEAFCEVKVVCPVPYSPPIPGLPERFRQFRDAEHRSVQGTLETLYPRLFIPPGLMFHSAEGVCYFFSIVDMVDRLRERFAFDLIHAHFTFPDGWVAARLAERYRVPVIITEHSLWRPWMEDYPLVRRQAVWAARQSAFHIAVSRAGLASMAEFTGALPHQRVVHGVVDGSVFVPPEDAGRRRDDEILFVGMIRRVKGLDLLVRALARLRNGGRRLRLVCVGDSPYASYNRDMEHVRALIADFDLEGQVEFVGGLPPSEVARRMQVAALLVQPSRRESLGMVAAEALACGTPVVATRCGGPEEVVDERVGLLVPPEDPDALADGIAAVLDGRNQYDPVVLRTRALEQFGAPVVMSQLENLYRQALSDARH